MSASAWSVYDQTLLKLGQKTINFASDTFKLALFQSTSNVGNNALATATYAAATNEVAAGNGYSTAGVTVAATWTNASGTETFDCDDGVWTPTGTGIVARYAVIYDSTTGDLICWCVLDQTPSDVNVQQVSIASAGVFTVARA